MRLVIIASAYPNELVDGVSEAGWSVDSVLHPLIARAAAPVLNADVVLVEAPEGLTAIAELREHATVPILATVPPHNLVTGLAALERGADMYVMHPLFILEVVARLEALARRANVSGGPRVAPAAVQSHASDVESELVPATPEGPFLRLVGGDEHDSPVKRCRRRLGSEASRSGFSRIRGGA